MSAPTKGPYFLHQDDGKMSIYPETWKGKPNREAMLALMATVSPWDGASQHDRSEVMAQAVANGHLLAASWEMREALMAARAFIEQNQPGGCDERLVMGRGVIHEPNCRACGQSKVLGSIAAALASARGEGR